MKKEEINEWDKSAQVLGRNYDPTSTTSDPVLRLRHEGINYSADAVRKNQWLPYGGMVQSVFPDSKSPSTSNGELKELTGFGFIHWKWHWVEDSKKLNHLKPVPASLAIVKPVERFETRAVKKFGRDAEGRIKASLLGGMAAIPIAGFFTSMGLIYDFTLWDAILTSIPFGIGGGFVSGIHVTAEREAKLLRVSGIDVAASESLDSDVFKVVKPKKETVIVTQAIAQILAESKEARNAYGDLLREILWEYRGEFNCGELKSALDEMLINAKKLQAAEIRREQWISKPENDRKELEAEVLREATLRRRGEFIERIRETEVDHLAINSAIGQLEARESHK